MENKKGKPKLPKKTPEELRAESHSNLLNLIIGETLTRHAGLSTEEYLVKLGLDKNASSEKLEMDEDSILRTAMFNILVETIKEFKKTQQYLNQATAMLRLYLIEGDHAEIENEEDVEEGK